MGLDMYLYKRKNTNEKDGANSIILEEVGYWRKANAIHAWIVNKVQDNVDNCAIYYFSNEKLLELLETCKAVKEDHDRAEKLLPTQQGFFFGSTEYDEGYFDDIDRTIEILEPILKGTDTHSFYYRSSW